MKLFFNFLLKKEINITYINKRNLLNSPSVLNKKLNMII